MPVERVCVNCGQSFTTLASKIAQGKGKCCSNACAKQYKRRGKIELICENPACRQPFLVSPSIAATGKKYCSNTCYRPPVLRICQNVLCGKEFVVSPSDINKGGGKFCSWPCRPRLVTPLGLQQPRDITTRLWELVLVCSHGPTCPYCCWEFQGKRKQGKWPYGLLSIVKAGKSIWVPTHRLMWEVINQRPVLKGIWILHHCDNPPCANPWHLRPGTAKDNTEDAVRRDRFPHTPGHDVLRGEALPQAKLNPELVRLIRQRVAHGEAKAVIARDMQVSTATIRHIIQGKVWAHVL